MTIVQKGLSESPPARDVATRFVQDGFAFLPQLFDTDLLERLGREVKGLSAGIGNDSTNAQRVGDGRFMLPVRLSGTFLDIRLLANQNLLEVLNSVLGSDLILNSAGVVVALPGAAGQKPHRDHPLLFRAPLGCEVPCSAVTVMIPLIDLDVEVGTTAIWLGSQRQAETQVVPGVPPICPMTQLGDTYLMDYRVIHGGTSNSSKKERPVFYLVYSRPWFRDAVNFTRFDPLNVDRHDPQFGHFATTLLRHVRQAS